MSLLGKIQCYINEEHQDQHLYNLANMDKVKEYEIDLNKFQEQEMRLDTIPGYEEEGVDEWSLDTYTELYVGCNELLENMDYKDCYLKLKGTFPNTGDLRDLLRNERITALSSEGTVLYIDNLYYETIGWSVHCKGKYQGGKCDHIQDVFYTDIPKDCSKCGQGWLKKDRDYFLEELQTVNVTFIQLGYYKKDNQLATVNAFIYGLNTDDITTGQKLKFNAFKNLQKFGKEQRYQAKLMIVGWETVDTTWEDIIIPQEYEEKFLDIKDNKDHFVDLVSSIAPNVVGYEDIKESMLLQAVMGGFDERVGGAKVREWMAILLAGDPGVAKSQLLAYMGRLHPKVAYGGGSRATKAGITVASVPDPRNKDRRIPKAGTLVIANKGLAIIDEFDKMGTEDKKSIQSAIEQGKIDVAMADIQASFQSETAILAACNPEKAFFNRNANYDKEALGQLNITAEILSRFDFIWIMIDQEHAERDELISKALRGSADMVEPIFDIDYIRYYIAWIRSRDPIIKEDLGKEIDNWYVSERKNIKDETKINARLGETMIRTCKALAKFRGYMDPLTESYIVTPSDFEEAKRILHNMMTGHGPTNGFGDVTRYFTGQSLKKENIHARIVDTIRTYSPTDEELKEYLSDLDWHDIEKALEKLQNSKAGGIFKHRDEKWRCV